MVEPRCDALTRALTTSHRGTIETLLGGAFGMLLANRVNSAAGAVNPAQLTLTRSHRWPASRQGGI
jgi:hypothetical protein